MPPPANRITRRAVLSGAALLGAGIGIDRAIGASTSTAETDVAIPFHGPHQAGIATPQQSHLHFAAFDLATTSGVRVRRLLGRWTSAAAALTAGRDYGPSAANVLRVPADTGETVGMGPAMLTLTFGFGPSLFESRGRDRFGLARLKPTQLEPLPSFLGEALESGRSGGDLCVQACANDPQVAFHAVHVLSRIAGQDATLRWAQLGWLPKHSDGQTPRNLLGFKDGTDNIRDDDRQALEEFVWVHGDDRPAWMRGGTYLVARRIELTLPSWDGLTLEQQERVIGRHKRSGAPLGAQREHDPVDLAATSAGRTPVIPLDAHIRLASPSSNDGQRILRRGYSFSGGTTTPSSLAAGHLLDGGLFFIAFVREPSRQFTPLQRRLATSDALSAFAVHTASAVFACPPGVQAGDFIGQRLFE